MTSAGTHSVASATLIERETQRLASTWVRPATLPPEAAQAWLGTEIAHEFSLASLLRRPGVGFDAVASIDQAASRGGDCFT